jgi:hypothetical protein
MKNLIITFGILFSLFLLISFTTHNSQQINKNISVDSCCQTFKLVDSLGNRISGCTIEVSDSLGNLFHCTTGVKGYCSICGLNPNVYYTVYVQCENCYVSPRTFICGSQEIVLVCESTKMNKRKSK